MDDKDGIILNIDIRLSLCCDSPIRWYNYGARYVVWRALVNLAGAQIGIIRDNYVNTMVVHEPNQKDTDYALLRYRCLLRKIISTKCDISVTKW